ncbi:TPA: hypothetical protein DIV55_01460 [Patescibacteria group bacterium]|uniref:Transglutaminase domain protein n=1 Tax=Candidatus Gottesmanbacteria bacterium GW2011_GWA1_43_11 TaxID=1618436 RepID=A0A0G1ENU7_9BACT|nr:MAG: Transglutaminase domain protein [Candidatus Gottesmanbacteria bacterium GW2011_GWA1_43_11]HCS78390.1 hypothetical protein [Patescibacteria group bacterium]
MRIQTLLIALFLLLVSCTRAYAADFSFDYDVTYAVKDTGTTHVRQNITITNETSEYYPRNYTLTISSNSVANVSARDSGSITPEVGTANDETTITVPFNTIAAGIHKQLSFTLEYDLGEVATLKGGIWEIIIPGTEKKEDVNSYTIQLTTPDSFGTPAYFSPPKKSPNLIWEWPEHGGKGISVAFGDLQSFAFTLHYHLFNESAQRQVQEITLPPDTAFQKIIVNSISETPKSVRTDPDGNWLATFPLSPHSEKEIIASGSAYLFIKPQSGFKLKLNDEEYQLYTKPQLYWEQSDEITTKARELRTPEAIYNFVVSYLQYDYSRLEPGIERLGAKTAFSYPKRAVCMEFSDLFVALTRSAGIPAREIHGYAYTTNSRLQPLSLGADILHAWAEYYDSNRQLWIPVDPTWGNTTHGVNYFHQLDFNHVAFAILGVSSDYPYPAGAFRTTNSQKDVFMEFTTPESKVPQPEFLLKFPTLMFAVSGLTTTVPVTVLNTGAVLIPKLALTTTTFNARAETESQLPPFATTVVPLQINPGIVWVGGKTLFTVTTQGQEFSSTITVIPLYVPLAAGALIIALFGILMLHVKRKITR